MICIITHSSGPEDISIFINDTLHIHFKKREFIGLQSWKHNDMDYKIELYFKCAYPVLLEYDSRHKWEQVLKALNESV